MTDLVAQLVGALEAARNQTRHPDYDWPICLTHEIDAALTAAKAGGWVAVPVEPTPEMQSAALPYVMRQHQTRSIYAAMLAARPLPNPPKEQA